MQISYNGINTLKEYEGFRAKAYLDSAGVPTIGFGTIKIDGKPVELGMECTKEQAEQWLYKDLAWAQTSVNQMVRVQLAQNQYDALVSFVYNEGQTQFSKSTLLRKLNLQDYIGAAKEFDKWVYAGGAVVKGLVTRRRLERDMFEGHPSN